MEKTYDPELIEQKCYQSWEENGNFKPSDGKENYSIVIPPPNVTGSLHMGHALQYTLMDALIRYHRMSGDSTLWQVGTDHAGIATQMVVERQLQAEGSSRAEIGRDAFEKRVWDWKEHSGNTITNQMRRLGVSVDWEHERFTMDEGLSDAVKEVFVKLYDEGIIYRGKRLVNWDPKFLTAISDLEVLSEEEDGFLWHVRYPLTDGSGHLTIATTRPETMLGDSAVAVSPNDARYKKFIGKTITLPLVGREIPIIADEYVDSEFGTGCVKITPAHDFNDYEMGLRHDLEQINILTPDAKINENAPQAYQGLDRFDARKKVLADLEAQGILEKEQPHKFKIPRGDRSGSIIEPYITDQWYVKVEKLAKPAIDAVKNGDIEFVPGNWSKTYFQWMENLQDWCISRQLWWGHRVPAWFDDDGKVYVGNDEAHVREKYKLGDCTLRQDTDVLDTWFSSALWPFSSMGWPEQNERLEKFYPTNVLVTGFDIIFFWVSRMIMMGLKFTDKIPFKQVYITALIRDGEGRKMSKSKGNVLDPLDLIQGIDLESLIKKRTTGLMQTHLQQKIEKNTRRLFPDGISAHGTDALRFTLTQIASPGQDISFDMAKLDGHRNFINKIWNAGRYVLMNVEDFEMGGDVEYSIADRWIRSMLQDVIAKVHEHFKTYRFDLLAHLLHDFVWYEFCSWYLELSKPILYSKDASQALKNGAKQTLLQVFEAILRLLHPSIPFITEEIWQQVAPKCNIDGKTIMLQAFPQVDESQRDINVEAEIDSLKAIITAVRNIRGEMRVSPAVSVPVNLRRGDEKVRAHIEHNAEFLKQLAKIETMTWFDDNAEAPPAATALVGDLEIMIPLAGVIDKDAEIKRLNKEIEKVTKELQKIEVKLGNENFIKRAPKELIEADQARCNEIQKVLEKHRSQVEVITAL